MRAQARHLVGLAVLLTLLFPALAEAKRVTLTIQPDAESVASLLDERVRIEVPQRGSVRSFDGGGEYVNRRCRVEVNVTASKRLIRPKRSTALKRLTLPDPYAERPYVHVFATESVPCPAGTARRIARSATLVIPRRQACESRGTTVVENALVRVYDEAGWRKVCARADRHRFELGPVWDGDCEAWLCAHRTLLAGRFIAASLDRSGRFGVGGRVVVRDAVTGRTLHDMQTGPTCSTLDDGAPVSSLVLRADGAVAWIVVSATCVPGTTITYEVRTPTMLIASGTGIDPASLQLSNAGVTWVQDGVARSAAL